MIARALLPEDFREELAGFIDPNAENKEVGWILAKQYHKIKGNFDKNLQIAVKNAAIKAVILRALEILGPTRQPSKLKREIYRFGNDEIDLDTTFEQILGKRTCQVEDIIVETREKKRKSCALIVDTSLSMAGEKLATAAVAAAVLAIKLKNDKYSLITFDKKAKLIKGMNERKDLEQVIGDFLDAPAKGYTNMEDGLRIGINELGKAITRNRFGVILTDGCCSGGFNPEKFAIKYPKLYVIMSAESEIMPEELEEDLELCRELARLGKGKMYRVENFNEVPRVLYNLLREVA